MIGMVSKKKNTKNNLSLNSIFLEAISSKMFVVAMLVFAIDRVSKFIAIESCPCIIGPFLNIIVSRNQGVAFGMFRGLSEANLIFTMTTIAISLFMVYLFTVFKEPFMRLGLSFMLGGALGNLFDRLLHGAVIDILDFHISIWRFPAFNFADAAITAGAIIIILGLISDGKNNSTRKHVQTSKPTKGIKTSNASKKRKSKSSKK